LSSEKIKYIISSHPTYAGGTQQANMFQSTCSEHVRFDLGYGSSLLSYDQACANETDSRSFVSKHRSSALAVKQTR
jgi:hypothetical protein